MHYIVLRSHPTLRDEEVPQSPLGRSGTFLFIIVSVMYYASRAKVIFSSFLDNFQFIIINV